MLRIIGRGTSSNVMKVLWACTELGLPFRQEDAGGPFGGNDSPEFLALNPNGLVPVIIEEDGFVLWESNSIVRYLAARHSAGGLCPADPQIRASAERWMDWQATRVSPAMIPVFRGLVRTPPEQRDAGAIAAARDTLSRMMAIMDDNLSRHVFMAGDSFTMADIPVGIAAWRWYNLPVEREPYAHLERWFEELGARPGYQAHVMKPLA